MSKPRKNRIVELADQNAIAGLHGRIMKELSDPPAAIGDAAFAIAVVAKDILMQFPQGTIRARFVEDFNALFLSIMAKAVAGKGDVQ